MRGKIKEIIVDVKESLWFIPTIMSASAVLLAFGLIELDSNFSYDQLPVDWFLYAGNRAGARSVLSTIASSMATLAGVTFSMTLVTLTLASSQYGPRLLRNFATDKGNQITLGTFVATFLYSLIVLLTINESNNDSFIPKFSIVFGFLLSVCSFGVLIYFIHHVSTSIVAENVIKSSFDDLQKAVNRNMKDQTVDNCTLDKVRANIDLDTFHLQPVACQQSGYLQRIDYSQMCEWAEENKVVIQLLVEPGDFCTVQEPQLLLYHKERVPDDADNKLQEMFFLGNKRTPEQEIRFSIKQIVEVGVRALSPGINDPHTAISCIHYLGAVLSTIGTKAFPSLVENDKKGHIRVIRKENSYEDIVDACFDHLRVYAKSNIFVSIELLTAIKRANTLSTQPEIKEALRKKAALIMEQLRQEKMPGTDLQKAEAVYETISSVSGRSHHRSVMDIR